ncbi:hypothetical protein ACO0SA_004450 [Hanseniaspora valbyensis]
MAAFEYTSSKTTNAYSTMNNNNNNNTFSNNPNHQELLNLLSSIYTKLINNAMFIPFVAFINNNILNVKSIISIVLFVFNYRKIKYIFKIYLIFHILLLSVYLYNRSIVKFINIDIPRLYNYMDKYGNVNNTIMSLYNNILLNNLNADDRIKVESFVKNYVINGFKLVVIPLKQNIIKTLQDIENLVHGYVKV